MPAEGTPDEDMPDEDMPAADTQAEGTPAQVKHAQTMDPKAKQVTPTEAKDSEDDAIRGLVIRLSRPHRSGGEVIERAAIMAAGADSAAVIAWITDHAGVPEVPGTNAPRRGLHGSRLNDGSEAQSKAPLRFVLPAGALA